MLWLRRKPFLKSLAGLSLLVACDDDPTPPPAPSPDGTAACIEMGDKCHAGDTGSGLIAECHRIGHVGDPDACLAKYDECMAVCMDSGHGGAGGDDHGEGGESHGGAGGASDHG